MFIKKERKEKETDFPLSSEQCVCVCVCTAAVTERRLTETGRRYYIHTHSSSHTHISHTAISLFYVSAVLLLFLPSKSLTLSLTSHKLLPLLLTGHQSPHHGFSSQWDECVCVCVCVCFLYEDFIAHIYVPTKHRKPLYSNKLRKKEGKNTKSHTIFTSITTREHSHLFRQGVISYFMLFIMPCVQGFRFTCIHKTCLLSRIVKNFTRFLFVSCLHEVFKSC